MSGTAPRLKSAATTTTALLYTYANSAYYVSLARWHVGTALEPDDTHLYVRRRYSNGSPQHQPPAATRRYRLVPTLQQYNSSTHSTFSGTPTANAKEVHKFKNLICTARISRNSNSRRLVCVNQKARVNNVFSTKGLLVYMYRSQILTGTTRSESQD